MRKSLLVFLLSLSFFSISQEQKVEKKGVLAFEISTLINQNDYKSLYHNAGVSLLFDRARFRFGGTVNFVLVERYKEVFTGAFAPAIELYSSFRALRLYNNDVHFGLRGGCRLGVFNYESYEPGGEIKKVPELESTSYLGPTLSVTRYLTSKFIKSGYLTLNFELNYMFALNAYSSNERMFAYKINKNKAILGDALHLKLLIGWGNDI